MNLNGGQILLGATKALQIEHIGKPLTKKEDGLKNVKDNRNTSHKMKLNNIHQ